MKGLGVLELLLGRATPLTLPQKSNQQGGHSQKSQEIIADTKEGTARLHHFKSKLRYADRDRPSAPMARPL
jgi:hypothetical protein